MLSGSAASRYATKDERLDSPKPHTAVIGVRRYEIQPTAPPYDICPLDRSAASLTARCRELWRAASGLRFSVLSFRRIDRRTMFVALRAGLADSFSAAN